MRFTAYAAIAGFALCGAASTTAFADDAQPADTMPATTWDEPWTFQLNPYVWFSGMKGDVGINERLPVIAVDVSFDEIFNNIDWWPPPVMLVGEARKGNFALVSDFIFLGLEADRERAIGPIDLSAQVDLDTIVWTLFTSWRAIDEEGMSLDLLAGGRLWNADRSGTLIGPLAVRERSGSRTWVDPVIGAVGRFDFGSGFGLEVEGDIGGFGLASDLEWQVAGIVQYAITDAISLEAGYRHLAVDYSDGPFLYDTALSGPIIGARFRF